jgi:hypothetical protein
LAVLNIIKPRAKPKEGPFGRRKSPKTGQNCENKNQR